MSGSARSSGAVRAPSRSAADLAYVLHRHDWSESSVIVDLFTRSMGRVAVAAKGAKRPYSQWRSVLMPFQRVVVQVSAAGEVRTLRSVEWGGGPPGLPSDLLLPGFYLNELLLRLLAREDPHPALFDLYDLAMQALSSRAEAALRDAGLQAVLRALEIGLLHELGVFPSLSQVTLTQQPIEPGTRYVLDPEHGVIVSGRADGVAGSVLVQLAMALGEVEPSRRFDQLRHACAAATTSLRAQLRALLHYHLGTPLRTRILMQELASP